MSLVDAGLSTDGLWASVYAGFGIRGGDVPASGTHASSPVRNDLAFPADADTELTWEILSRPVSGTLTTYEDLTYTFEPPNGTANLYASLTYRVRADGAIAYDDVEGILIGTVGSYTASPASVSASGAYTGFTATYVAPGSVGSYTATMASVSAVGSYAAFAAIYSPPGADVYTVSMASLTGGGTYAGGAAIYTAPNGGAASGPTSDVSAGTWTAVPSGALYAAIDEATANDSDYITSPISGSNPCVMGIGPWVAGTYTVDLRADVTLGGCTLRVKLQDNAGTTLATSADQALTTTPTLYSVTLTIAATATRISIEVA